MSDMTFWFGQSGSSAMWYLNSNTAGVTPIDISQLPGPQYVNSFPADALTTQVTGADFDNQLVYFNRVVLDTGTTETTVDTIRTWNLVKNMQVTSDGAQQLYVDGIVHVDAQIGVATTDDSYLFLNGVKRANVITGGGDDTVEVRMTVYDYSAYSDDFRINTGAGDDFVRLGGLDVDAELAQGDTTYSNWLATGRPLITTGENQRSFIDLGAGNDRFVGYASNDHVIGGVDAGTLSLVYANQAPSGFGYSIGGAVTRWDCSSFSSFVSSIWSNLFSGNQNYLYKINLATGQAEVIGKVSIPKCSSFDVESLAFNPVDGFLYGFAVKGSSKYGLIKVDATTGATTLIGGKIAGYASEAQDMAFDKNGNLFMVSEGDLLKVNLSNGNFTRLGDDTLSKKIAALAIDPDSGTLYGLSQDGSKAYLTVIDKNDGSVIARYKISGLEKCGDIEGMSFDSTGVLWAEDRVSGKIYQIDLATYKASYVSTTLGVSDQKGDGFESLAIDNRVVKVLDDIVTDGGDIISTGAGIDHIFYHAGDGVDVVTDFDLANDVLHITGYTAANLQIDELNGSTFIRFVDGSADGFVDNAVIKLDGVTGFNASSISNVSAEDYFLLI